MHEKERKQSETKETLAHFPGYEQVKTVADIDQKELLMVPIGPCTQ